VITTQRELSWFVLAASSGMFLISLMVPIYSYVLVLLVGLAVSMVASFGIVRSSGGSRTRYLISGIIGILTLAIGVWTGVEYDRILTELEEWSR
jgi:hypothetical protein